MTEEKKNRSAAVRISGEELKRVLEELPRDNERSPHVYKLPNGGTASRILIAGMLTDKWQNAEGTTRGIKLIDPAGDATSLLASKWTPELMEQIDTLEEKSLLMVMAKLSVYDSGDRKVQYPKLEAIWKIDLDAVKIWKTEVEAFRASRKPEVPDDDETDATNNEFFAGMNTD